MWWIKKDKKYTELHRKVEDIASILTFDDFLSLCLRGYGDISSISYVEGILIIERWVDDFSYLHKCFILKNKVSINQLFEMAGSNSFSVYSYDNMDDRILLLSDLHRLDEEHTPPNLIELKILVDKAFDPYDSLLLYDDEYCNSLVDAKFLFEKFEFYFGINQLTHFEDVFISQMEHGTMTISGIDAFRGCKKEQSALAWIVRRYCHHGKKCILELWDIDSGFETLSTELKDLGDGIRVEYCLAKYQ